MAPAVKRNLSELGFRVPCPVMGPTGGEAGHSMHKLEINCEELVKKVFKYQCRRNASLGPGCNTVGHARG